MNSRRISVFSIILRILTLTLFSSSVCAWASIPSDHPFINGYSSSISGEVLPYFSIYPKYAREALLTRCTDGKKIIEWYTDTVPPEMDADTIIFRWIAAHSSGTSSGERHFDLFVDDAYSLTFSTTPKSYPPMRSAFGQDGTSFSFEFIKRDGAEDAHGMAYLRVPRGKYVPGKPLRLKVVGHAQESNDWFMTFRYTFTEKVEVRVLPFLLRADSTTQPLRVVSLHFGEPDTLMISFGDTIEASFYLQEGFNVFDLPVPIARQLQAISVQTTIGDYFSMDTVVLQQPVILREIGLIHHAHTDIGYSHIQEDVIRIHTDNIRKALKLIDSTADAKDGSAFVWNIESSWAVEHFLAEAAPDERQRFFAAVKSGRIGVSATYLNVLTGLSVPEEFDWLTAYSRSLRDSFGLPCSSAMLSDIPGVSWNIVAALARNGVRYFSNGPNYMPSLPDGGDRIGHTLREFGDRPFWWLSPDGRDSILFWTCAKGYSSWHGITEGAVFDRGPEKIADYLDELQQRDYPYDMVQWRYNIVADNGPVDRTISTFVNYWNETYISPRIALTDVTSWFERFEKRYGASLPRKQGDFTPYWEDGAYSTAAEEARNRELTGEMVALEQLASAKSIRLPEQLVWSVRKYLLLFHEHTWGSWNSVSDPDAAFTRHQWAYKRSYLDSSAYYLQLLKDSLAAYLNSDNKHRVFNPSPFTRDVLIAQVDGVDQLIPSVPPFGSVVLDDYPSVAIPVFHPTDSFEIHPVSGAISAWWSRGRQWVDTSRFSGLLDAFYLSGTDTLISSSAQLDSVNVEDGQRGCWRTVVHCGLRGTNGIRYEVARWPGSHMVRLSVTIDKKAVREKESIHLPLPFNLEDPQVRIGVADTFYVPGDGQLSAANKDFYSVQRWIDVSDRFGGITIASPQGALFEIGEVVDERKGNRGYKSWRDKPCKSSTLYLYALNNYWHTNFKAEQEGSIRFDVYLDFHGPFEQRRAQEFGESWTVPPVGF